MEREDEEQKKTKLMLKTSVKNGRSQRDLQKCDTELSSRTTAASISNN